VANPGVDQYYLHWPLRRQRKALVATSGNSDIIPCTCGPLRMLCNQNAVPDQCPWLQSIIEKLDDAEIGSAPISCAGGGAEPNGDMEVIATTAWERLCNRVLSATELTMARKVL
jgi:hypothetical protein